MDWITLDFEHLQRLIISRRCDRGYTQKQIAAKLNMAQTTYSRCERNIGSVKLATIVAIMRELVPHER